MSAPRDLTCKVRQLDNVVQAIYGVLAGISATQLRQGNRLEEISGTQANLAAAQAEHGAKLDELAATQTQQGVKLGTIIELLRSPDSS